MTNYGWDFMLAGLKLALERHPGEDRIVAWPRVKTSMSREEAYAKLTAAGGLFVESPAEALRTGQEYAMQTVSGDRYSGRVEVITRQRGFCVTIRELKDPLPWLSIEGAGQIEVQAWLSAFGLPKQDVDAFGERWEERLQEMFAG